MEPLTSAASEQSIKYRAKSVSVPPGGSFRLPFESAGEGSLVRIAFTVHEHAEAAFEFSLEGQLLYEEKGEAYEVELTLPSSGMCEASWSNSWLSFYPIAVSYEVVITPAEHLVAMRVRRLLQLARQGDLDALRDGLATTPADAQDERGLTALHAAASAGKVEAIAVLLDAGAPIDATSLQGCTPLMEACASAHAPAVADLLNQGASVGGADAHGRNCIHLLAVSPADAAVAHGGAEKILGLILSHLRQAGGRWANGPAPVASIVHARDADGVTPLVAFAAAGHSSCCAVLLDAMVSEDTSDVRLQGASEDASRALIAAAAHGRESTAQLLLAHGAHPARSCGGDGTAVHAACKGGHAATLRVLLRWLQDQVQDGPAHSPMHTPIRAGGDERRVSVGTEEALTMTDGSWRSPLLCAASAASEECIQLLLEMGAPLEQHDAAGDTPLLCGAAGGKASVVAALLAAGAKAGHVNSRGQDALGCAASGGHMQLLPLLLPVCASTIPEALIAALVAGHTEVALELVRLCKLPRSVDAHPSSDHTRVVEAIWRRGFEEGLAAQREAPQLEEASVGLAAAKALGSELVPGVALAAGVTGAQEAAMQAELAVPEPTLPDGAFERPTSPEYPVAMQPAADSLAHELEEVAPRVKSCADRTASEYKFKWVAAEAARGDDGDNVSPSVVDEVTDIQELIRRELAADDSEEDESSDDDNV